MIKLSEPEQTRIKWTSKNSKLKSRSRYNVEKLMLLYNNYFGWRNQPSSGTMDDKHWKYWRRLYMWNIRTVVPETSSFENGNWCESATHNRDLKKQRFRFTGYGWVTRKLTRTSTRLRLNTNLIKILCYVTLHAKTKRRTRNQGRSRLEGLLSLTAIISLTLSMSWLRCHLNIC